MTLSTHIGRCENCNQDYCCECSEAQTWASYCSVGCEEQAKEDEIDDGVTTLSDWEEDEDPKTKSS